MTELKNAAWVRPSELQNLERWGFGTIWPADIEGSHGTTGHYLPLVTRENAEKYAADQVITALSRPAPAATDTGLETVAQIDTGRKWRVHFLSHPVRGEELVTRSQAEELLAAERKEVELWKRKAEFLAETVSDLVDKITVNNARIKEREQERDEYRDKWKSIMEQEKSSRKTYLLHTEQLEAKLATAEADAKGYKSTIEHLAERAEHAETILDALGDHLTVIPTAQAVKP